MKRVLVFAGTTEGREMAKFLGDNKIDTLVFVATEYGETLIEENLYVKVLKGRLDCNGMIDVFTNENPRAVIDSTHPYAKDVTKNIKKACEETQIDYIRLLREEETVDKNEVIYLEDINEVVEFLNRNQGNVLVTTGSKEVENFTHVEDFNERLFLRILPMADNLEHCIQLGFKPKNIICMLGPFSKECNEVMLDFSGARYLVTKESGAAGGFDEKIQACKKNKVIPIVIGRPKEDGMSFEDVKKKISKEFGLKQKKEVFVISGGLGSRNQLTLEALNAIEKSQMIITTKRLYNGLCIKNKTWIDEYKTENILKTIKESRNEKIAVIFSGDIGFFSEATFLREKLEVDVKYISGISSKVYFLNKIGKSYEDTKTLSVHGREENVIGQVVGNKNTLVLLGGENNSSYVCQKLVMYGLGELMVYIGSSLGGDKEKINCGKAKEFVDNRSDKLELMLIENKKPEIITHGKPDNLFKRGQVPMTKEEVRTVSISKLELAEDSIVYDVGAGTGSISCEIGSLIPKGVVYAIEKEEKAINLIKDNKIKLKADNVKIIKGFAPEALKELPSPTSVFIGGSSGELSEIIKCVINKNLYVRIVINIVSLNTLSILIELLKKENIVDYEIIQIMVSRNRKIGIHNLMEGQNPVYIVSFNNKKEGEEVE